MMMLLALYFRKTICWCLLCFMCMFLLVMCHARTCCGCVVVLFNFLRNDQVLWSDPVLLPVVLMLQKMLLFQRAKRGRRVTRMYQKRNRSQRTCTKKTSQNLFLALMFNWHVYFFVTTGFCVTRCGQTSHRTTRRKSRRTSRRTSRRNRRRNGSVFERICHRGQSKRSGTSRRKGAAKILVIGTTSLWARGLREDRLTPPAPNIVSFISFFGMIMWKQVHFLVIAWVPRLPGFLPVEQRKVPPRESPLPHRKRMRNQQCRPHTMLDGILLLEITWVQFYYFLPDVVRIWC